MASTSSPFHLLNPSFQGRKSCFRDSSGDGEGRLHWGVLKPPSASCVASLTSFGNGGGTLPDLSLLTPPRSSLPSSNAAEGCFWKSLRTSQNGSRETLMEVLIDDKIILCSRKEEMAHLGSFQSKFVLAEIEWLSLNLILLCVLLNFPSLLQISYIGHGIQMFSPWTWCYRPEAFTME